MRELLKDYLNNDGRILSTPISLIADIFHADYENYKKITAMYDIELQAPKQISKITYEFLEPQELSDKAKCVITAHLETDGDFKTVDYTLTGIQLDPEYMTTDRLWELLYGHYELYGITKFEGLLEDFVVKFILHLRGE